MDLEEEEIEEPVSCSTCGMTLNCRASSCGRFMTYGTTNCWFPIGAISVADEETQTSEDKLV